MCYAAEVMSYSSPASASSSASSCPAASTLAQQTLQALLLLMVFDRLAVEQQHLEEVLLL
jgi:hypothetical protein